MFCLGLWFAGFFGGNLQLYNLTERGMSLRMLIDVAQSGERGMTAQEIMRDYSAGQGIAWMYQKRLDVLLAGRLIRIEDGAIVNERRGRHVAPGLPAPAPAPAPRRLDVTGTDGSPRRGHGDAGRPRGRTPPVLLIGALLGALWFLVFVGAHVGTFAAGRSCIARR